MRRAGLVPAAVAAQERLAHLRAAVDRRQTDCASVARRLRLPPRLSVLSRSHPGGQPWRSLSNREPDAAAVEQFIGRGITDIAGAMTTIFCIVGDRLGLFRALDEGSGDRGRARRPCARRRALRARVASRPRFGRLPRAGARRALRPSAGACRRARPRGQPDVRRRRLPRARRHAAGARPDHRVVPRGRWRAAGRLPRRRVRRYGPLHRGRGSTTTCSAHGCRYCRSCASGSSAGSDGPTSAAAPVAP